MTKACRTLFQQISVLLVAGSLMAVSGCTPAAGPDISVSTYGVSEQSAVQSGVSAGQISLGGNTAPHQAPAVIVGTESAAPLGGDVAALSQASVPGAIPPSAGLPVDLTLATNLNPSAGALANSESYVTDGVEKPVNAEAQAPLTPSDVAGQTQIGQIQNPQIQNGQIQQGLNETGLASLAGNPAPNGKTQQVAMLDVSAPSDSAALASEIGAAPKAARNLPQPKPTLFGNLFGNKPKKAQQSLTATPEAAQVQLASLDINSEKSASGTEEMTSLPGVNTKNLFALDPSLKGGDEPFDDEPEVQVASATAAGLARLAPNGLLTQTEHVDVACLKPQLVSVLKQIEGHYGKKVVVTSGYRSSKGNRRAGGSRNSMHISCAAADIQIAGVDKWQLAKYLRTMPGRGGVGTYCHTDSVHVDIGSTRDWNWRCRRK